ncbi:MAG: hypothetical protein AMS14_08815 [Planctomycetes bacterium DG_20]|nr:MAG: hypothetical protein AMS14_08815 [Planctomycetes bacterium DG_20]
MGGMSRPGGSTKTNVSTASALVDVVLTLDVNAYAQHDVLADTQEVPDCLRGAGTGILQSVTLIDYDDNARAIDLIFLSDNKSIGTENAAVSVSDANAAFILGVVRIAAADYIDMVNAQFAMKAGADCGFVVWSDGVAAGSDRSIWVAAVYRDATGDTYTAAGIKLRIGILQD